MNRTNTTRLPASTADILSGGFRRSPVIASEWRAHYDRLLELRDQIITRKTQMVATAQEERPTFSEHMGDAGTDQYDQDFALGMISADQQAIYEIEQAIDRIRNGTYGICELTGRPIERERLEIIPWTRYRLDAQLEIERSGNMKRTRLGKIIALVIKAEQGD